MRQTAKTRTGHERIEQVIALYTEITQAEHLGEIPLADLLTDIMHFCRIEKEDFYRALATAQMHFREEASAGAAPKNTCAECGRGEDAPHTEACTVALAQDQ